MKDQLVSLLRHAFTGLAGFGAYLFSKGLIDQGDVSAVNGAGASLGNALVVILAAVIGRLLLTLLAKVFRAGSGEQGVNDSSSGGTALILLIGTAAVLGGLPSCSPAQLSNVPIRIGIQGPDVSASYSSKSGIQVDAVIRPEK